MLFECASYGTHEIQYIDCIFPADLRCFYERYLLLNDSYIIQSYQYLNKYLIIDNSALRADVSS